VAVGSASGVEDGECLDVEHGQIHTQTRTQTQWALPRCGGARPDPDPNPDPDPDPDPVGNTSMWRSKAFWVCRKIKADTDGN